MAAIVSQLAAANRRRKEMLKRPVIPPEKCVYLLPPFDPCFKPEVHNRYMRQKKAAEAHQEFVSKVGSHLTPVHIERLTQMGQKRLQTKVPAKSPAYLELEKLNNGSAGNPLLTSEDACEEEVLEPELPVTVHDFAASICEVEGEAKGEAFELDCINAEVVDKDDDSVQPVEKINVLEEERAENNGLLQDKNCKNGGRKIRRKNSGNSHKQKKTPKKHKKAEQICRVFIAVLCLMSLMPLVALVIYLVGIFAFI